MSENADIQDLVRISRYAGDRFDLIQAGGGNTSVKTEKGLWIKASGLALSEVKADSGYCCVDWLSLSRYVDESEQNVDPRELEQKASKIVQQAILGTGGKPSIETLMHCLMNRLTLHTHPIAIAAVACRANYKDVFTSLFDNAICVDYHTPGAALAIAIDAQLRTEKWQTDNPAIVFLQNHGLIVSAQTVEEVISITEAVNDKVANHISMDLSPYKLAPQIANIVNQIATSNFTGYLSEDKLLSEIAAKTPELLLSMPATPDQLVYCGPQGFTYDCKNHQANVDALKRFAEKHGQMPKVFIADLPGKRVVVLLGANLRKCKDAEDVLKAHCLTLNGVPEKARLLPESEIAFLSNWDAEKYRQKI